MAVEVCFLSIVDEVECGSQDAFSARINNKVSGI